MSKGLLVGCVVGLSCAAGASAQEQEDSTEKKHEKVYTVWLYQRIGDTWKKHDDRTYTFRDARKAWEYVNTVSERKTWQATTNAPLSERPLPTPMTMEEAKRLLVGRWLFAGSRSRGATIMLLRPDFTATIVFEGDRPDKFESRWAVKDDIFALLGTEEDQWVWEHRIKDTKLVRLDLDGETEMHSFVHVSDSFKETTK